MMKPALLGLALMLFTGLVSGLTIDSPGEVPTGASWGFSADVGAGSTATVQIDGSKVVEVYSNGAVVFEAFSPRVSNAFMFNGDLVVYHVGLSEGPHTITVDASSGSGEKEITAVPLPNTSEILSRVDARVNEKLTKFDEYDQKFLNQDVDNQQFWAKINQNVDSISGFDSRLSSLDSQMSSLSSKVEGSADSLQSQVASLQDRLSALEGIEGERKAALLAEEEARKNSPLAGLFSLAGDIALPIGIVIVLLIIVGIVLVVKDKLPFSQGDSLYSQRDEDGLPLGSPHDNEIAEELTSSSKWAFKK